MADWLNSIQTTRKDSGSGSTQPIQSDWLSNISSGSGSYQPNILTSDIRDTQPVQVQEPSLFKKATTFVGDLFAKKESPLKKIDLPSGLNLQISQPTGLSAEIDLAGPTVSREKEFTKDTKLDFAKFYEPKIIDERRQQARTAIADVSREVRPDYEEPGVFGSVVEAITEGTIGLGSSFGASAEMIGNMTNSIALTSIGQKLNKESQKILASNPEWREAPDAKWSPTKVARLVASAVPSLLATVASTFLAGPFGAVATGFGLEAGGTYQEAIDAGVPEDKAQLYGSTVGTVNGIIESIFPSKLFDKKKVAKEVTKQVSKSIAKDVLKKAGQFGIKFAKDGVLEGSTEALQEMWGNIIASNYDENRKPWDNLLEAFVGGFGAGGITGATLDHGEYTPQEVMDQVVGSPIENTEEGKVLIKSALEAQEQGNNIVIGPKEEVTIEEPEITPTPPEIADRGEVAPEVKEKQVDFTKEAKKYKTADEFIKAQGETVYHGTTAQGVHKLKPSGVKGQRGENQLPGIYVTDNYAFARDFSKKDGIQINEPIQIQLKGNVLKIKNINELKSKFNTSDLNKLSTILKDEGYDAVEYTDATLDPDSREIIILNEDVIKTRNELNKIYNKAKKEVQAVAPTKESGRELTEYYASQDQEAVGQAWFEVLAELDIAEAGSRTYDADGNITGGISSTFPSWVPSGLRTRKLFDSVLKDISDPTNMKFPPNSQPRKQALYKEILSVIDSRANTDSSNIIEGIESARKEETKPRQKEAKKQDKKPVDKGVKRSEVEQELISEAKKFKTAKEFIKEQGIDNKDLKKYQELKDVFKEAHAKPLSDIAQKRLEKFKERVVQPTKLPTKKAKAPTQKPTKIEPEAPRVKPPKLPKDAVVPPKGFKVSKVIDRVKDTLRSEVDLDETIYKTLSLDDIARRSVDIVNKSPDLARDIISGFAPVPDGVTKAGILIASAEQARKAGDFKTQKDLIIQRSFMQTRHGQEIVTEKLVNSLDSDRFIRDVLKVRMDKVIKKTKEGLTVAKAFSDKVSRQAQGTTKKINRKVINKLSSAQKILDDLMC